jgi:hypothetical protein
MKKTTFLLFPYSKLQTYTPQQHVSRHSALGFLVFKACVLADGLTMSLAMERQASLPPPFPSFEKTHCVLNFLS